MLETNLLGPFRLMKAILPSLLLQKGGAVVNISSDAAVSAYPRWGAYGVSKAALDHLTRIFAAELEGQGVRFHAFDPGDMDTPMHLAAVPGADRSALRSPEESARRILAALRDPDVEIRRSL
ncbi:MAG: SDR family NAD(P)-dependent oxidoreductase [Bdellovibrionota bacterium]